MLPNTEAIYREFPFIGKYYKRKNVITARVSRITSEFLDERPNGGPEYTPGHNNGKIMLFDQKGILLGRVGTKVTFLRLIRWMLIVPLGPLRWCLSPPCFQESVGQALLRLGQAAYYAVWLKDDGELIVYKPPKGFTVTAWYEEQIRRAAQSVLDSLDAIDRDAVN